MKRQPQAEIRAMRGLGAGRPPARETVDLTGMLLEAVANAQVVSPDRAWRLDLPPRWSTSR